MIIRDNVKAKMKLFKKQNNNFNYCLTDLINKYSKYNSSKNNSNKLSSFNGVKNKLNFEQPYFNFSFKKKAESNKRNNIPKIHNEIIKLNNQRKIIK